MNTDKLIISLYDYTTHQVQPYIKAGYPVMCWDKKIEGDILEGFSWLLHQIENTGLRPYGIFAGPPCTDYASSGARWWPGKDAMSDQYGVFDNSTELSDALVLIVLHLVDLLKPVFWSLENPVGRIESRVPELKPYRRLIFNPCDYGDPYTKKTILWGQFNERLIKTPVFPLYGSLMHNIPPGDKRQEIRSTTPMGFANAFFNANR